MRKTDSSLLFSPSDLTRFLQNPYVTWMDRLHLEQPGTLEPDKADTQLEMVFAKGLEHERLYLESLKKEGRDVCEIPDRGDDRVDLTLDALSAGNEIIYQAALQNDNFAGYADFLIRSDRPSKLGDYSYEVWDTKLSLKAKPYFIIQLCCYAEILEELQGFRPETIGVVLGDGSSKSFRTADFFYYYLFLKRGFLEQQRSFDPSQPPEPQAEGKNGRWESVAKAWLTKHDHLSLVAGITSHQIERLRAAGIDTVVKLAKSAGVKVPKMRAETFDKLCQQARLQVESRSLDKPAYEIIPPDPDEPTRGLALLPPASKLDVAFDIEGYPLADGGLEYLLGTTTGNTGKLQFSDWWAHDDREEKRSFEAFIDWVFDRWQRDPTMHIYHYAQYEVTAARRLMTKYATRENEVDRLLRAGTFVDLYRVVRQGIRMGIPSYSLKKVEAFYLEGREAEVVGAADSIVYYQKWLETQDGPTWETSDILREIREYNREDCDSTWMLIEWLRARQQESNIEYHRQGAEITPEEAERDPSTSEILARSLLDSIPDDETREEDKWRVRELLSWLLTFHRREEKPMWWAFFERHAMTEEELWDDADCLSGLERTNKPPFPIKRSTGFEYRFDPAQDTKISESKPQCTIAGHMDWGNINVAEIDLNEGIAVLKAGPTFMNQLSESGGDLPDRLSLVPDEYVSAATIASSIERVAHAYDESGELPSALDDFLMRRRPRIRGRSRGSILREGEDILEGTLDVARRMKETTLCIQGPPGSGKTHTAAHLILGLIGDGKRIGVCANSHKAICNLMIKVAEFAEERDVPLSAAKVGGDKDDPLFKHTGVVREASMKNAAGAYPLIGGTAWAFSNPAAANALDYLFVDEAGQVCIANLTGMVPSTKNIILLGDQMQLGQPTRGVHPGESGLSTLQYLLQDHPTIPDDLGIFLGTTWRLHPELCSFISEAVYEGRLKPEGKTGARKIMLPTKTAATLKGEAALLREAGICYIPVEHSGNVQGSEEEAEAINRIVRALQKLDHTDLDGKNLGPLSLEDILIVAPYNLQIRLLKNTLGTNARIGTIDKFQGQEAPVVIVSMCASAGDTSPRGIEFLFNKNRLNVAISRAMSLAIVVGHQNLTETICSSIVQMELVNLFCRVVEEGR